MFVFNLYRLLNVEAESSDFPRTKMHVDPYRAVAEGGRGEGPRAAKGMEIHQERFHISSEYSLSDKY